MKIYLHVPFCVSRCIYCDFFVVLEKHGGQVAYVEAVCREIEGRLSQMDLSRWPQGIETLYVGGGTPSLLSAADYQRIFDTLTRYLPFHPNAEITLEANPGGSHRQHGSTALKGVALTGNEAAGPTDANAANATPPTKPSKSEMADDPAAYRAVGFNRISVGVQSLHDAELRKLSRVHSAAEAENFIWGLHRAGWDNISLDLMYGLPLQTEASWQETLQRAMALPVTHISMYGLKVEAGTPLERLTSLPGGGAGYTMPEDEVSVRMYFEALRQLKAAGFTRYEFSNLVKPGYESKHNLNYWEQGEWLALGPSAHGYLDGGHYENVRDLAAYLANPLEGTRTPCPAHEQLENALIFGLRKADGIDIPTLEAQFHFDFRQRYGKLLERYEADFFEWQGERLSLKESAIPMSHTVLAEFLETD
jgi:oxygen-independent coproporphyrinogen III oxidase